MNGSMGTFHIVLFEPEIPPNTGNIIRLCANTGASLHLIEPLGFELDEKRLRRAGLDYHEWVNVQTHASWDVYLSTEKPVRIFAFSTRGKRSCFDTVFQIGDSFVFGPETRGLPDALLNSLPEETRVFLPMQPGQRSLNLSNSVAVAVYEAWRQTGFTGLESSS